MVLTDHVELFILFAKRGMEFVGDCCLMLNE